MFQYSFCSYSTEHSPTKMTWFICVSIQLLFLFNRYNSFELYLLLCFNTASVLIQHRGGTWHNTHTRVSIQLLFLFNFAICQFPHLPFWFQYSFCSYSTLEKSQLGKERNVSIQLLFLFNPLIQKNYLIGFSFNTASVLIQQSIYIEIYPILDSFNTASVLIQRNKYSIKIQFIVVSIQLLFLFNKYGMKFYKVDCEFQYSFCSYSTSNYKRILNEYGVSIQLLFLFNY